MIRMMIYVLLISSIVFAQSPIPSGAKLEKVKTGFKQPEGPVWKEGAGILFSDIQANKIFLWSPYDSSLTTYLYPSDSSNGLTFDLKGRLVLTQMARRRISVMDSDGTITPIVATYKGKKFNSPNDIVVKSDSTIFFTDPDFNIPYPYTSELGYQGIYSVLPSGKLTLLDKTLNKPNGICFSPDEKKLFVNESAQDKIYVWDVVNDTTLANKKLFYSIPQNGYADGMKIDTDGNVYCSGPTGIWIVSPAGKYLDKIAVPEGPSNCAWGDADRKTLYITAGSSLYRIHLAPATDVKKQGSLNNRSFNLFPNYPNPFNPVTTIGYTIPVGTSRQGGIFVQLKIYDIIGNEVATLVNKEQTAGDYHVKFNAENLASGIYLYQLRADNLVQTRKMVLMR